MPFSRPVATASTTRPFLRSSLVYIALVVVLSVIGLAATFPDQSHATSGHVTLGQVVFGYGTVFSPPVYFMAIVGLLVWGSRAGSPLLSRVCLALAAIVVIYTGAVGVGVLADGRPDGYSTGKWAVALVLGVLFLVASVAVIVTGVRALLRSRATSPAEATVR